MENIIDNIILISENPIILVSLIIFQFIRIAAKIIIDLTHLGNILL
jgi:hypothetical protein